MPAKDKKNKELSLQELILNTPIEKYKLIPVVIRWIKELEEKEENKSLSRSQLLDLALKDILSDKVSIETVKKLPPLSTFKKNIKDKK